MTKQSRVSFPFALLWFWFRRTLWLWLVIGFFIFIMQIIECAIAQDNERVRLVLDLLEKMPGFIKGFMGSDVLELGGNNVFVAMGYQHPLVLTLYMIFVVCVPTGLLAGHVQSGTMELVLSRSVTKNQVYVCACILTLIGMFALVMIMFAGTVAGVSMCGFRQEVSLWPFFKASVVGGLISAASAGVALLAAATFRTRGKAVALAMAFFIANYFIDLVAEWWPRAKFMAPISLFYYEPSWKELFAPGWPMHDMCVLSSVFIVTVITGGIIWNRRDLPL